MAKRSVTIKDIAERLGVSYSSVSRALSGKRGVREDVRKRALDEARKLGYFPNALARGLVMRKTQSIGLVITDITNPFFSEIARGVVNAASESGYAIFLCDSNFDLVLEERHCRMLLEKRVDGIIIAPVSGVIDAVLEKYPFPVVYLNLKPKIPRSHVVVDHAFWGRIATRHLIDAGYRRIAYLGGSTTQYAGEERLRGYREALRDAGRTVDESLILEIRAFIGDNFTGLFDCDAIFCANDILALHVLQQARLIGIDVPGRLGIVGFDGIAFTAFPGVDLSTISQPKYAMGYEAASLCIDEIERRSTSPKAVILQCKLEIRETSRGPGRGA